MKLKLSHFLIIACFILLGGKIFSIFESKLSLSEALFAPNTRAQETKESKAKDGEEADNPEETAVEEVDTGESSEESTKSEEEGEETKGDKDEETKEEDEEEEAVDLRKDLTFTETEVEILKRLQQRRQKLEQWEADLRVKDNVLKVTQTKIDQKIEELRSLKKEVEKLLAQYNEKEDAKIRSLVKIYESMKPKDAAKVFEELEMDVLLQVIDRMKESKSALILAKMNPEKTKALTVMFAEQRKLETPEKR